jgi:hypothetical protein
MLEIQLFGCALRPLRLSAHRNSANLLRLQGTFISQLV